MKRINPLLSVISMSAALLLQAACSKQEPVKPEAAAPAPAATPASATATSMPKAMDMPMPKEAPGTTDKNAVHHVAAVVKGVDAATGSVTLSHGPVATLNWPPMTMGFKVRDQALMDKLGKDKQVEVDFVQDGSDYVVTAVR